MEPASPLPTSRLPQTIGLLVCSLLVAGGGAALAMYLRHQQGQPVAPTATNKQEPVDLVKRGRLLYHLSCAACHGPDGRGDGPSAGELKPPPRDFALGPWKFGTSPAAIRKVIADGIPGSPMPGARAAMSDADLDAVVAFVRTLAPPETAPPAPSPALQSLLQQAGFTPMAALRPAPALELRDTTGRAFAWSDLRGQLVILNFWGTNCPSCIKELPTFERLVEDHRARGVAVICVCADEDDPERVQALVRGKVSKLPVYVDAVGTSGLRYEVAVTPTAWLIDPTGRLLGKSEGVVDWSKLDLPALLTELAR